MLRNLACDNWDFIYGMTMRELAKVLQLIFPALSTDQQPYGFKEKKFYAKEKIH